MHEDDVHEDDVHKDDVHNFLYFDIMIMHDIKFNDALTSCCFLSPCFLSSCLLTFCFLTSCFPSNFSCINSPDVIFVHDGKDKTSAVIGQLCNTNSFVELVSTGPNLYIEFISRSHFPGQGFKGRYTFETIGNTISNNGGEIPSTGKK